MTSFSLIQNSSDGGNAASLVFFAFDLLYLDGEPIASLPLVDRKIWLEAFLVGADARLQYGRTCTRRPAAWALTGSCRSGGRCLRARQSWPVAQDEVPSTRGVRCGRWTDSEGTRAHLGSLLLGYCIAAPRAGATVACADAVDLYLASIIMSVGKGK